MGVRPLSNRCSGNSSEVADDEIDAHLGNAGQDRNPRTDASLGQVWLPEASGEKPYGLAFETHTRGARRRFPMDTHRNPLFGVLALQGGLIRPDQFVEARATWANRNQWFAASPMEIGLATRQQCRPSQRRR
jgi:hypothetical protein